MELTATVARADEVPTGRGAELGAVFEAHHAAVLSYARRRTRTREEAEDVAAETFVVATRRADEIPRRPRGWLLAISRRVLANRYRAEQRRDALVTRMSAEAGRVGPIDPDAHGLAAALNRLSESDRELLLLRYWDGASLGELCQAVECSRAAAYVRLHRARSRLSAELWPTDSVRGEKS